MSVSVSRYLLKSIKLFSRYYNFFTVPTLYINKIGVSEIVRWRIKIPFVLNLSYRIWFQFSLDFLFCSGYMCNNTITSFWNTVSDT